MCGEPEGRCGETPGVALASVGRDYPSVGLPWADSDRMVSGWCIASRLPRAGGIYKMGLALLAGR